MKKVFFGLIIIIFCTLLLVGCQNKATLSLDNEYSNSFYKIKYPKQWTEKNLNKMQDTVLFKINADSDSENFGIVVEKLNMTADKYLNGHISQMKTFFDQFKLINSSDVKIDGQKAVKVVYWGKVNNKALKYMQLVTVKAGNGYIFNYTARKDEYQQYIDTVNAMIDSFSFN